MSSCYFAAMATLMTAAIVSGLEFPQFRTPLMLSLEVTNGGLRNETAAVTEYVDTSATTNVSRVDTVIADGTVQTDYLDRTGNRVFRRSSAGNCTQVEPSGEPMEIRKAIFLNRFLLLDANTRARIEQGESTTIRGASVRVMNLKNFAGSEEWKGRSGTFLFESNLNVKYFFTESWGMPEVQVAALRRVELSGTGKITSRSNGDVRNINLDLQYSVMFSTEGTVVMNVLEIPSECLNTEPVTPAPDTNATEAQTIENPMPMPTLPPAFSATIETNMIEAQRSFTVFHDYSEDLQISKTTMIDRQADLIGRRREHTMVVVGAFQLAYEILSSQTPSGHPPLVDTDLKNLLWRKDTMCTKNVFNFQLMDNVKGLLLATGRPRYMGKTTVRGIPARIWQARGDNFDVQWFFGYDWRFYNENETPLLRIVIRGSGKSPLFVHHPFLLTGTGVPEDAVEACGSYFGNWNPQCRDGEEFYTHVHDFTSFIPAVDRSAFNIPQACFEGTDAKINAIPDAANCSNGLAFGNALILALLFGVFGAMCTAFFFYMRQRKPTA